MMRLLFCSVASCIAVLFLSHSVQAQKQFGFDNRKPSGQPYLKPEETVARFNVPPEFEVKLFAGEPQLVNPIAFTIDEKGRIWVIESFDYPKRAGKNVPRDRIVILEDTDGNGTCDKRTVFAEGKDFPVTTERKNAGLGAFDMASGIEVGHGGIYVGAAPYLWFIENQNDHPGKFEVLLRGFGSQDTHETLNTFQWGPDGWLYGLHGIFTVSNVTAPEADTPPTRMTAAVWRYHPTQKKFEIFSEGTSNPWGMDWRNTDGQFILACCVIPHLYHMVPGGIYKRQAGASLNPYVYGYLNEICDHTFHKESGWAHAGLISLDVPHMPKRFHNSVIFGSIHGCSIKQNILKPKGSTFTATRGDDFLKSGDKNFRPINMKWGPVGDIYLIDWHDQNPCHQTAPDDWDYARGRIYRIQLKGTRTRKSEDLSKRNLDELQALTRQTNPYAARTALRLLGERTTHAPAAANTKNPVNPQHSFTELMGAEARGYPALEILLEQTGTKTSAVDRGFVIRKVSNQKAMKGAWLKRFETLATTETDPTVRRELASAAIRLAETHDVTPLLRALITHQEDTNDPVIPQLVWLAYEKTLTKSGHHAPSSRSNSRQKPITKTQPNGAAQSSTSEELAWLASQAPSNTFVRDQIIPRAMRRLVATGRPDDLKHCIAFARSLKDINSREKALDGLAIALNDQTVTPPEGWTELQAEITAQNNPRLVPLVNRLAVSFRDPRAIKRALETARNTKSPVAERVEAVRQIGQLKVKQAVPLLLEVLRQDSDVAVRAEAARTLAVFDDAKTASEILRTWKAYPKAIQPDVVNALATRKEWARQLLQAMADGKIERTAVTDNTILRIQTFKDAELNKLIAKAWGRSRPTPAELIATINKSRLAMNDGPASFARGKLVFENTCGKCHKFEGKGADVGPALDGAARDIEYILVNVIDPNRVIGAPYFVRVARLADGTVQQGLLAEEDDKSLTLKLENGVLKKIERVDLEGPVLVVEKSLMPEGLGYNMTPQDFRDLVRYVMANPFLTDVTVNGTNTSSGVFGRILLPASKDKPTTIDAHFTAIADLKTVLLVGSSADFEVRLDGKVIASGFGTGKKVQPDQNAFEVRLTKGSHTLSVTAKVGSEGGALFTRFVDLDRKLRYPDVGAKK